MTPGSVAILLSLGGCCGALGGFLGGLKVGALPAPPPSIPEPRLTVKDFKDWFLPEDEDRQIMVDGRYASTCHGGRIAGQRVAFIDLVPIEPKPPYRYGWGEP